MEMKLAAPLFFVHGLRDHAGTHTFFFDQLNREGCHILSFDLLGLGYSSGERYTIYDYRYHVVVWCRIIRALKEYIPQGIPVVIMGYSYGFSFVIHALNELITKNAAWERIMRKRVAVVIGLSPVLKVGHTASPLVQFFAPLLAFMSRHIKNIPLMSLNPEKITDDEDILSVIETDPQVFKGRINMHTARNIDVAGRTAQRLLPKIKLPFMLIFGSEDFVKPVTPEEIAECKDI
jgi:alpha-beta hydrolase superfamily lysophospholipase